MWGSYYFGVEIELIAKPRRIHHPLQRWVYYEELAESLRHHGAAAIADKLKDKYSKHPEYYDRWWITKDGSLGDPDHPLIPLEAVSPVLSTDYSWEFAIDTFWKAWQRVFHEPITDYKCGSHIHVSPSPTKRFDIHALRSIAFGVVYYEDVVLELLPSYRRNNAYCQHNTKRSTSLQQIFGYGATYPGGVDPAHLWKRIKSISNLYDLRNFMQGSRNPKQDRYVLWNFDNILPGRSGTVEFRGGRGLRGEVRTKRWIAFVVAFIHKCISTDWNNWIFAESDMRTFWMELRDAARDVGVQHHLPSRASAMAEGEGNLDGYIIDDDDMLDKSDSEFSDSDIEDEMEYLEMLARLELERTNTCVIL